MQWCSGAAVQCSAVQWCSGAVAQWCGSSVVHRCTGGSCYSSLAEDVHFRPNRATFLGKKLFLVCAVGLKRVGCALCRCGRFAFWITQVLAMLVHTMGPLGHGAACHGGLGHGGSWSPVCARSHHPLLVGTTGGSHGRTTARDIGFENSSIERPIAVVGNRNASTSSGYNPITWEKSG